MPPLIQIQDAVKRFADKVLLNGATASLTAEQKVGMIGRNGAGKSTLCRAILGDEELETGEILLHPRLKLGYLRQHDPFLPDETVIDFLRRDSEQLEWKCGQVAGQFEIKGPMLDAPVKELSGGWQTRVKLAALLLHDPNYLLLDEPTNFLDLRTQLLLEKFLRNFRGGCLVVSHDRAFLKETCTHTLELSLGKLTLFPGDVDQYLIHQVERREHDKKVNETTKTKQKQLKRFIDRNRAGANTASQAKNKAKQLDRLELLDIEGSEATAVVRVPEVPRKTGTVLRCEGLSIGYPDHVVAKNITLDIEHRSRIGVVGDNGQGKTTLLRTLTDSLTPLAGDVKWGHGTDIGIYAQHVYTTLPPKDTVEDYLQHCAAPELSTQQVLNVAGSFLFRGDDIQKRVKVLSGGERARLCLAGLLLGRHNVLLLDEPGNHLDVETVEALCNALEHYNGTVIFTSHDRYFMRRVATEIVEVKNEEVVQIHSDYEHYLYRLQDEVDSGSAKPTAKASKASKKAKDRVPETTDDRTLRKEKNKQLRTLRKELSRIEAKVETLDKEKKAFNKQLLSETDAIQAQLLHDQMMAASKELEQLEEDWLTTQDQIQASEEE
ncbi:MAG: ABC-F family ATP-binding cassette domain-containing protein [Pirellulales bacterium]